MVDGDGITDAARALGGKAQGAAGDLYGRAREAVRHAADEVSDHASEAYASGQDLAWDAHQRSVAWPHTSLLAAGLVGFGLGFLVSRL